MSVPPPIRKHPSEVRRLAGNFGKRLKAATDFLGTTVTLTGTPTVSATSGLTVGSASISGPRVLFTASSGTADNDYVVTITVTTSNGETWVGQGTVEVRSE